MFEIIQEAVTLPKLSETSLFDRFNKESHIGNVVVEEIKNCEKYLVPPSEMTEVLAMMKLNGGTLAKKAVDAYIKGRIVIIFNKETSNIPPILPYIVNGKSGKVYIFAARIVTNITSTNEYRNLMAVMEAAYLALRLYLQPSNFLNNPSFMLKLSYLYNIMAATPLETKMGIKGENLVKARLYLMAYFYRMFRGNDIAVDNIPFKQVIGDKVDRSMLVQIVDDVKSMQNMGFLNLLSLIAKINPVRYGPTGNDNIAAKYVPMFSMSCGIPLTFALENISYLFLLMCSAPLKTTVTQYALNQLSTQTAKDAIKILLQIPDMR